MTIGIVTRGPQAGHAAMEVLRAVEALGSGAIGGFAVLRWRMADGRCDHASCQDLGSQGLEPSGDWREASHAAIISSGPNRPTPLTQFIAADPAVGFVTGHRLPTSLLPDGRPVNEAALEALRRGALDTAGLAALLAAGPAMDAGLICLPWEGPVVIGNAPRVESRDDIGSFCHEEGPLCCAVLHNSIHTAARHGHALAATLGGIGLAAMGGRAAPHRLAAIPDRLPVQPAGHDALELDTEGRVIALHSADPAYFSGRPRITAVYQSMPVVQNGRTVGQVLSEVFAALETGVLIAGPSRHFVWAVH